jgi:hypothetical protein
MNNGVYIWCLVCGFLGVLFHIFVVKLPSALQRAKVANVQATIIDYFAHDWVAIAASFITVIVFVVCLDEFVNWQPDAVKYIKALFVFIGFTGSSILIAALGKFSKTLNGIIDVKTDVADGKTTDLT